MNIKKTSIRYFQSKPVRAIWDDSNFEWYYSATDIISILVETKDPRKYWNNLKKRHLELLKYTKLNYLYSNDDKKYLTDTINEKGITTLSFFIPTKNREILINWIKGSLDPIDEQSKKRAYELYDSQLIDTSIVGTTKCLQQIHSYLFSGLYDFAGKIRTKTISKGGFVFANGDYLLKTLKDIDSLPDITFDDIVNKYVEMNIAHPFMEGNGRSTRIWLDMLFKERLKKCIDWSTIDKKEYLNAMTISPYDSKPIYNLLKDALTDNINNREVFIKGIDYSYYYEEIE